MEYILQHAALLEMYLIFCKENRAMIMTNKLLPVALIAALIGGSVGALVMHKSQPATAAETVPVKTAGVSEQNPNELTAANFSTAGEQTAYKTGFADGYAAAMDADQKTVAPAATRRTSSRVVYRNSGSRA